MTVRLQSLRDPQLGGNDVEADRDQSSKLGISDCGPLACGAFG